MAKRTTKKSPTKGSETSFRAIKRQAKVRATGREGFDQKRVSQVPTTLIGREARAEERFRELVAWFMLQGVDEPRARQRACDEIDEDPRKD
jgi:hypothetical protein